jgi:hypothetical protein
MRRSGEALVVQLLFHPGAKQRKQRVWQKERKMSHW